MNKSRYNDLQDDEQFAKWSEVIFCRIIQDPWRKLLALVFAVLIYLTVNLMLGEGQRSYQREITVEVPVQIRVIDEKKHFWYQVSPKKVYLPVQLSMFSSQNLVPGEFEIVKEINLGEQFEKEAEANSPVRVEPLRHTFRLSANDVTKKPGGCKINEKFDREISIQYDQMDVRSFPIQIHTKDLPKDFSCNVSLSPDKVSVSGPVCRLNQLQYLDSSVIMIPSRSVSFECHVKVRLPEGFSDLNVLREYSTANVKLSRTGTEQTLILKRVVNYILNNKMSLVPSVENGMGSSSEVQLEIRFLKNPQEKELDDIMVVCDVSKIIQPGAYDIEMKVINLPHDVLSARIFPDRYLKVNLTAPDMSSNEAK